MRRTACSFVCTLALAFGASAQHPVIQQLMDEVSIDHMLTDLRSLSGEDSVEVDGAQVLIRSRFRTNPGNALAATWLQQRLAAMGYTPVLQTFGNYGGNVLAELPGQVHPQERVIICGHFDAMPAVVADAPAADDDGSGTVAVLEAARLMASLSFERTIVFALWDEEEQGLVGSDRYATIASSNDEVIAGVVNLDAIAYDGDGDRLMRLHVRPIANSQAIRDTVLAVNEAYGIDLPIHLVQPGMTYSDHASFWSEGFGAVLIIEDFEGDGNPHYHTPDDRVEHLDLAYWHDLARLGIATTAALAVPYDPSSGVEASTSQQLHSVAVHQPGAGRLVAQLGLTTPATLHLEVLDAMGRVVLPTEAVRLTAGRHAVELAAPNLAAGVHLLRCTGPAGVRTVRFVAVR